MITIELAGVPVGKGRAKFNRHSGIAFTPQKTRSFESALRVAGTQAMRGRPPIDGPCAVLVEAAMPISPSWPKWKREAAEDGRLLAATKPDLDNVGKAVLDGLNTVVWVDDRLICDLRLVRTFSDKPALRVTVVPLEQAVRA